MAQKIKETRFKFRDKNFPILFEDRYLRVYKNPSNEIFVEGIRSGASMRIDAPDLGLRFTTDGRVEPVCVSNMIGWMISRRT